MSDLRYKDYGSYFRSLFDTRVQKLSIDAGFTCPNIDGSKGVGGCTYCLSKSFKPDYCKPLKSVSQQINDGVEFFAHKKDEQKYLAYFQAHSNTYAALDTLKELFAEALKHKDVRGLVISTRPDCVSEEVLDYLTDLASSHFVALELGVESCNNKALEFVNRQHSYEEAEKTIMRIAERRHIHLGVHLIMGLPYDDRQQCLENALRVAELPITTLKFHQLQILKGTAMAKQYKTNPVLFDLFEEEEYLELCVAILEQIHPEVRIDRFLSQVPPHLLVAPKWNGVKNFEFANKVNKKLLEKNSFQGKYYKTQ